MQNINEQIKKIYHSDNQKYTAYIYISELFNPEDVLLYPSENLFPSNKIYPLDNSGQEISEKEKIGQIEEDIADLQINYITQNKLIGNLCYKKAKLKLYNADKYDLIDKKLSIYVSVSNEENEEVQEFKLGDFKVIDDPKSNIKENEKEIEIQDFSYILDKKISLTDFINFPTTIKEILKVLSEILNLKIKYNDITNLDYIVEKAPYVKDDRVSELIKQLGEATASNCFINNKNEIVFKSISDIDIFEINTEDILEFEKGELTNDRFDTIIASRIKINEEESTEDVYYSYLNDENLAHAKEYKIIGNGIIDTNRLGALPNILNKIKNVKNITGSLELKLAPFLEPFDILKINNNETSYFYLLDTTLNITTGLLNTKYTKESKTRTEYQKATTREKISKAELSIDKINGEIKSIVSRESEKEKKLTEILQNIDDIKLKTEGHFDFEEIIKNGNIINTREAEAMEILEFKAESGRVLLKNALYPSKKRYPSKNVFPENNTFLN